MPPTCTSPTSRSWASTSRSTSDSRPRRTGRSNRATGETERQARPARKNHDTTPHAPPRRRRSNAKRGIRHNQTARLAMPDAPFCIMKRPSEPTLWATAAWRGRGFGAARWNKCLQKAARRTGPTGRRATPGAAPTQGRATPGARRHRCTTLTFHRQLQACKRHSATQPEIFGGIDGAILKHKSGKYS